MTAVTERVHEVTDPPPLQPVLTLTEEELLVLTDGSLGVVPARVPEPSDPDTAALVRSVALRCLMARGLVLPTGVRPPPGSSRRGEADHPGAAQPVGVSWEAVEPLGLTLTLRELAPAVLGLRRVLGAPGDPTAQGDDPPAEGTSAVRYLHLHDEIAVIEDVSDAGMHSLLPVFPDRYHDAVADFIRPPDATAGRGGVRSLDGTVEALLGDLGGPTVLVESSLITGLHDGVPSEPVTEMLALGPGGTFRSHDSVTYHPVDPDGAIRDLLAQVMGVSQVVGSGAGAGGPT